MHETAGIALASSANALAGATGGRSAQARSASRSGQGKIRWSLLHPSVFNVSCGFG
jgi:hypothetical protein